MARAQDRDGGRHRAALAALQRDAALGRIGRTRRWIIAGAAALTAALAGLASALVPGRSLGAKLKGAAPRTTTEAARPSTSGTPQLPPPAGPGALGLQGPDQAPQSSAPAPESAPAPQPSAPAPAPAPQPQQPAVVSGGS